jgi:polygalacturonase
MAGDIKCAGIEDQVCIQTAIDNMNVTGGTVILSDGTFVLNNQIRLCNNLNLKGQGMNKTILFVQNNAATYANSGTIRSNRNSNIYMSILYF